MTLPSYAPHPDPGERSEWFPEDVKPKHRGIYEIRFYDGGMLHLRFWNGSAWFHPDGTGTEFGILPHAAGSWRGLARKPKK